MNALRIGIVNRTPIRPPIDVITNTSQKLKLSQVKLIDKEEKLQLDV